MSRYDIFHIIHKGLRASLYQTALQLQQTDFSEPEEMQEALDKVKEIVMLFDGHAHKEDRFILPAVNTYEPSVSVTFEAEHVKDEELGRELQACINRVENAVARVEKIEFGEALIQSFVAFMVFNLQHMAKEEDILNQILWRYYSDEEIKAIGTKIAQASEPWMQDFYATWMLRGINNREAINWIGAIKKGMPALAYQTLLQKLKQEYPSARYRKVTESLNETLMPV
jgi:hemerythrin-like domain-containing protein